VMPGADAAEAARIAERARRTTESREFLVDRAAGSVSITVSIGLAEWREGWDSAELYRRADRALYLSKSAGRNRVTEDAA
jgi:two-component system, cell cycle response regulator